MSKRLIIDINSSFLTSLVQDNQTNKVSNIYFDSIDESVVVKGNIYLGYITRISTALEAMFVSYGGARDAFLPFVHLSSPYEEYQVGDKILIQVLKEAKFKKGVFVTTQISLSGCYLVYMPLHKQSGVKRARSLGGRDTQQIEAMLEKHNHKSPGLLILRSACAACQKEDVEKEYSVLINEWMRMKESFASTKQARKILYSNTGVVEKIVNEYASQEVNFISVSDQAIYNSLKRIYKGNAKLLLYKSSKSIFKHYQVSHVVDSCFMRTVKLSSGGSLTIEPTEALTSIDVNSGKFIQSESLENTALQTNLAAVEEICNQIKFRNINGIIIIDTIDLQNPDNRAQVEMKMLSCLKEDKAKTYASKISVLGIIELSRQNIGASLYQNRETCRNCLGTSMVMSQLRYISELGYTIRKILKSNSSILEIKLHVPSSKRYSDLYRKKLHNIQAINEVISIKESSNLAIPDCVIVVTQQPTPTTSVGTAVRVGVFLLAGFTVMMVVIGSYQYLAPQLFFSMPR